MKSSTRQTKIPFSERKLRVRSKDETPQKLLCSDDENSPLKYRLVVNSESKIILRRASESRSTKQDRSCYRLDAAKRGADKLEITTNEVEDSPTPSKRKCDNNLTEDEQTPVKETNTQTPSTLLSKLQINSAKSSCKRSDVVSRTESSRSFKPKELFPKKSASSARKALYSSSNYLPCRDEEIKNLFNLLEKHLEEESCGSIYVAGLPGTGKTASIEHVVQNEKITKGYNIVKINCTSVTSSAAIYKRMCSELRIKIAGKTEKDPKELIDKFLLRKHKMILLILDEIDQLETRSQSVLYQIFEWPSWEKARLVLIGIANAMDLTDRILPRLCAKVELKPVLLYFPPYTKDQIKKILSHRLSQVGADTVFTSGAIELISAKVASMSGDIRRALDLGRRVVEVSEETKATQAEYLEKDQTQKIDQDGINSDLLTDFLRLNDYRRSPRKLSANGEKSVNNDVIEGVHLTKSNSDTLFKNEMTPTKHLKVSFLSPSKKTPQSKKRLFDEEQNENGPILREIKYNPCTDGPEGIENYKKSSKGCESSPGKIRSSMCSVTSKVDSVRRVSPRKHSFKNSESTDSSTIQYSKIGFSVDSRDVLNVVNTIYGSSKSLKNKNENSSFPLHQKILISTFVLISKKGKIKDLNIGKLHQVYTKVCTKRGITPVDQSGFLFLCRQVEMTGILQIGKGHGKLAKISLQWDETEVTNALKDMNLLSSILNDVSCL